MAHVIPFIGVLYNPEVVKDMARAVAPPYDVIDAGAQQTLHDRHPNNVVRLELGMDRPGDGPERNRYTRAAGLLGEWLANGTLRRDREPAVYPYSIDYRVSGSETEGRSRVLKGFLATIELEEFESGGILPHEHTHPAAKTDRLRLLEACRAHFSPIFSLFSDPEGTLLQLVEKSVNADKPRTDFTDDSGFRHRLWSVTDQRILDQVVVAMMSRRLFIADGHHRYETALAYRRQRREQDGLTGSGLLQASGARRSYDSVLMLCSSLEDPGLTVLPTHRVLNRPVPAADRILDLLRGEFTIEKFGFDGQGEPDTRRRFLRALRGHGQSGQAFGLALRDAEAYYILGVRSSPRSAPAGSPRDRLDVSVLHHQVLPKLCPSKTDEGGLLYTKDDHEALELVRRGSATAALLLNPTKVSEVRDVAAAGERMPHKSTYFFPKPLTGLVMNVMED
ncbi:MAG: DUF1015 domain-containing protein [Nitrospiraceae bacterium]